MMTRLPDGQLFLPKSSATLEPEEYKTKVLQGLIAPVTLLRRGKEVIVRSP